MFVNLFIGIVSLDGSSGWVMTGSPGDWRGQGTCACEHMCVCTRECGLSNTVSVEDFCMSFGAPLSHSQVSQCLAHSRYPGIGAECMQSDRGPNPEAGGLPK